MNNIKHNIFLYILIGVAATMLYSCKKSYETIPLGQQTNLTLAFDPKDSLGKEAMEFLLNVYNEAVPYGYNRLSGNFLDAASDDAISSASGIPDIQKIATGAFSAASPNVDNVWSSYYSVYKPGSIGGETS